MNLLSRAPHIVLLALWILVGVMGGCGDPVPQENLPPLAGLQALLDSERVRIGEDVLFGCDTITAPRWLRGTLLQIKLLEPWMSHSPRMSILIENDSIKVLESFTGQPDFSILGGHYTAPREYDSSVVEESFAFLEDAKLLGNLGRVIRTDSAIAALLGYWAAVSDPPEWISGWLTKPLVRVQPSVCQCEFFVHNINGGWLEDGTAYDGTVTRYKFVLTPETVSLRPDSTVYITW